MNNTKVTLLGNCQTKALTWYIQQLNPEFDVQWVQPEFSMGREWGDVAIFNHKHIPMIREIKKSQERLKQSSFLIYQHLNPKISKHYNFQKIKSYNPKCRFISISSYHYNPNHGRKPIKSLSGMIERAEKFNIDIPGHKIIKKYHLHEIINSRSDPAHPRALYFLDLIKEICTLTGWNYYSDEQHNQYLKQGYPFG